MKTGAVIKSPCPDNDFFWEKSNRKIATVTVTSKTNAQGSYKPANSRQMCWSRRTWKQESNTEIRKQRNFLDKEDGKTLCAHITTTK